MRKLFYLSGSLFFLSLTLLIGFHLGQRAAQAEFIPATGYIVGLVPEMGPVLTSDGQVWTFDPWSETWSRLIECEPPVPVSQIKGWGQYSLVTTADELYVLRPGEGWISAGSPPGGVATNPTTWGQLKQRFGG